MERVRSRSHDVLTPFRGDKNYVHLTQNHLKASDRLRTTITCSLLLGLRSSKTRATIRLPVWDPLPQVQFDIFLNLLLESDVAFTDPPHQSQATSSPIAISHSHNYLHQPSLPANTPLKTQSFHHTSPRPAAPHTPAAPPAANAPPAPCDTSARTADSPRARPCAPDSAGCHSRP